MPPFIPSLLLVLHLAGPALLNPLTSTELEVRGQRTPRDANQDSIKVVISEGCATQGDSSDPSQGGKEIDLAPGSPLVLTHKIKLVPSGSGSGSCGCEADFAALRERLERLEREVSALREKCGGPEGNCCTSKESKGAGCSIKPETECPNECSDQGRCVDGKCVCFPGFNGPDCSNSDCPGNCNDNGRCVNGQCVCDPGFTGPDCSQSACPDNCNNRGRCVNGRCVCDSGFSGPSCSDESCPGNCNNRGRCVNGQCMCNPGFTAPDCSQRGCPGDCNDRGRCVNGKCVCDSGFTGDDCSESSCPGNCNNRGRCINGQCVCDDGFTGDDCSEKACPNNCSKRGKCVNGKCVCDVGFTGPDCAAKGCPNNCSNKGRCVKGSCVCRRGFTGPDCSQCLEGRTGPNCDTVMSGVSQLSTEEITETSVTLVWTPPPVQYETYHLTFTSQKESDQKITVQVEGSLTTFTQTGLAAGQEYSASIVGEIDGRRGAEISTEFMTLISGPTNLQVVKTTSTSAVVQWEQSQGEIDRYLLTVTPNDGTGRSQEMTIPAGQNSAHIQQLEAGRLYDVILVAEKGSSRSKPATTQAVPGQWVPRVTTAALTMQGTQDAGINQELNPSPQGQVFDQQGRKEANSDSDSAKVRGFDGPDSSTVIARTKPLVSKIVATNGTRPKFEGRPTLPRKPKVPGLLRFNATRVVPGGRRILPGPFKKAPVVGKKKEWIVRKKPEPSVSTAEDSVNVGALSSELSDDKSPTVVPGTDLETNSSEEPTPAVGSKDQPDVGMASHGHNADLASPEPTGTIQGQEKKCMNKIKVTHIKLPLKDRGNGCRGDGKGLAGNTLSSIPGSPITSGTPPPGETDLDYSPDPLHTLLTDTFKGLNITTFSVHLSKPSDVSVNADEVRTQILRGLQPLPSFSSSSSSLSTSKSSSHSSPAPSSSLSLTSLVSSASTAAPSSSLTYLIASSLSPPPPSSSSSDKISPLGSNELDVDNSKSTTDSVSPEDRRLPLSGADRVPLLRQTPPKHGYGRRPHPNFGPFQNKTNLNFKIPHRSPPRFVPTPGRETEKQPPARETETSELSSSPSSSSSEESSPDEVNTPVKDTSRDKDGTLTPASSIVEQNQKKLPTERGRIPVRRPLPKGGILRRPFLNVGPLQNRTRPNLRPMRRPSQPINPEAEKEQEFTTPFPATSSPSLSRDSYPSDTGPVRDGNEGGIGARMSTTSLSTESNETLKVSGVPSSHHPNLKVGLFRRTQPFGGSFQNRTRTNLRPPQYPQRGPVRKPLPNRKLNTGSTFTVVSQTSQLGKDNTPENQSEDQDVHRLNPGGQNNLSGRQGTSEVTPNGQIDTTVRPQTNEFRNRDNALIQTEETGTADFDIRKESVDAGKSTETTIRGRPTLKQTSSHSRPSRPSRPVTLPKKQPPARTVTGRLNTQVRQYISGSQKEEDQKTSNTKQITSAASDVSPSGVAREPLDFVGVTNRTSDGFTLIWDSPEGKYKNFVVTRTEKDEGPKQKERKEEVEEDSDKDGGSEVGKGKHHPNKEPESENGGTDNNNRIPEGSISQVPKIQSSTTTKPTESAKTFKKVLHGSARSFQFEDLPPKTDYTLTLLGKGPGLLSRLHKLVISTGPEPPTNIIFSKVTENSLTVSWTKPKSPVSGFKVTYTHTDDGEPVSVTVDSEESSLGLVQLSPGSSYEVTVISTLDLDESDPIKDFVMTLPDPPTDLRAVNVTDSTALLLWRPALAAVDKYAIVYGSGTDSELRVTVSGNAAEQQLSGLEGSTTYTVTITSLLGSLQSSAASTSFTTTGGSGRDGDGPRDLQANSVTPRTAMLSWKPPSRPVDRYRLTYQTEGQEMKEVIVDATVTQLNLSRLYPGSKYLVQLQAERGGRYTSAIATEFTTGTLRFPFPTDCSQELLNGIFTSGEVEIFPQGKHGTPMLVYCDMEADGGGWTVFQRRKDGSVDFFRGWKDYTKGFGDVNGEFWLGLESLHNLTAMTKMTLRVDLRDGDESVFAQYSTFEVAKRNYKLSVGGYTGTAGDSLTYHNNRIFSTKDRDPATFITRCAMSYRGGWWYKNCHEANLNGLYGIDVKHQGVIWTSWKGKEFSIPFTEMKMRPTAFRPPARG